jgi:hypothetical protein
MATDHRNYTDGGRAAFMAGVAFFDDLLRDAERRARSNSRAEQDSLCMEARLRDDGVPLVLYALPFVQKLQERPDLMPGFAAALGDYVGMLQQGMAPGNGDQYSHLTFEDCVGGSTRPALRLVRPTARQGA